jgi:ankyrin repeat protein
MSGRHFPVRPNLRQLRYQAKDLLRAIKRGAPEAVADLRQFHPNPPDPPAARLADAQRALARSYGLASWARLVLERHLARDPDLLDRTFAHEDIYPPALGCPADRSLALHATPLAGGTLLHLCMDYDEPAIARWLLAHGADVNAAAAVDSDGFGGHTALFGTVVTQPGRLRQDPEFARLLLDHGADPNARASLRKRLRGVDDETEHEYRDVTPLAWGRQFHDQSFVSRPAMALIEAAGGRE